jgi:outer membrane biosynthesis protein TonB
LRDEANYTNPDVIGTLFLQYLDSNPSSDIRDIHPFQLSTRTATAKARVSYDTFSQKFAPRDNDNRKVRDLLEIHKDAIVSAAKALYEKRAQQAASPQQAQPTGTPSQVVPPQPPVALPPQAQPAVAPVTPSPPVVQQPLVPPVPPPPPPQPPVVQQPIAQQQPQVPQQPQPMQGVQAALGNPAGGSDGSMPTSTFSNPWMTDDTRQLAQLLTTYDENVYKSMLSRLGADQNYRKIHAVPAQNEFRELLYGPPVSGGDIRQMNRILDTSMEPSTRHMELKLIEFRGLVLSIISDLLPHNATPSVGAVGNVEYDAMESQIPLERVDAMEVDSGVRPYEAQPVLRYQDDQDDIMSTLPQSFRYLMRSLSSIGLKDLRVPFMKFFECMTDVVTNNNAARYRELHSKLNEIVSELPRLRFKMGEMHFQKLMMSAGTTRASIESLIYLADKKINAARELQMIDSILKNKRPAETSTESRNRPVENGIKRRRARM